MDERLPYKKASGKHGRYGMKKILTLMLAAGMTLAATGGASAVDLKVSGTYDFSFSGSDNLNGSNSFMDSSDYRHNTGRLPLSILISSPNSNPLESARLELITAPLLSFVI